MRVWIVGLSMALPALAGAQCVYPNSDPTACICRGAGTTVLTVHKANPSALPDGGFLVIVDQLFGAPVPGGTPPTVTMASNPADRDLVGGDLAHPYAVPLGADGTACPDHNLSEEHARNAMLDGNGCAHDVDSDWPPPCNDTGCSCASTSALELVTFSAFGLWLLGLNTRVRQGWRSSSRRSTSRDTTSQ